VSEPALSGGSAHHLDRSIRAHRGLARGAGDDGLDHPDRMMRAAAPGLTV
jgi:hypothetical protein